jgi:hypothetical protein
MLAGFSPRWHFAINLVRAANDRKSIMLAPLFLGFM